MTRARCPAIIKSAASTTVSQPSSRARIMLESPLSCSYKYTRTHGKPASRRAIYMQSNVLEHSRARARCAYVCMFFRHVYAQNATLCAVVLSKYPRGHMFLLHLAVSCEHTWKRHAAAIPETHRHARHHHSRALRSSDGMAIFRHSATFCNVCVYNVTTYFKMTNDFELEQTLELKW